jgi:midasin
LLNKKLSKCE